MLKPIELTKSNVDNDPYLVWNTFIQILTQDYNEMSDIQAVAHHAFWYDSEVQNGGHIQFFENVFSSYKDNQEVFLSATYEALNIVGAEHQAKIIDNAIKQYYSEIRKHPSTVEEFVELELEDEFGKFDELYYKCSPEMNYCLETYLQAHKDEFVQII
jgi:Domain of unknown function (DUF4375)